MLFILMVKAHEGLELELFQDVAQLAALLEFHESMVRAGRVLAVEALQPCRHSVRVRYADQRTIVETPFSADEPHVIGFWLIHVNSLNEAIQWATRVPLVSGEIEVRQIAFQLFSPSLNKRDAMQTVGQDRINSDRPRGAHSRPPDDGKLARVRGPSVGFSPGGTVRFGPSLTPVRAMTRCPHQSKQRWPRYTAIDVRSNRGRKISQ